MVCSTLRGRRRRCTETCGCGGAVGIFAHGPVLLLSREAIKEFVKKAMCTATGATDERNWPTLVLKDTSSKIIGGSYIPAREGSSFYDEVQHSLHPQDGAEGEIISERDGEHRLVLLQRRATEEPNLEVPKESLVDASRCNGEKQHKLGAHNEKGVILFILGCRRMWEMCSADADWEETDEQQKRDELIRIGDVSRSRLASWSWCKLRFA